MENTDNRELKLIRTVKASVSLVWQAWTEPGHIAKWWGPNGHTTTIHKMDFREDGEWQLTIQDPNGQNYPNRSIFREIIPFKKIVFEHFNPHFITTVLFEPEGKGTQIEWSTLFDTSEMLETVIKVFNAKEGQQQNLERLEKYLEQNMEERIITVERIFNANRQSVWRAITQKDMMKQWYFDLKEFKAVVGFKFEFQGGEPGGKQWKHLCEVTEVIPESKLTYSWKYEGYSGISYVTFELLDEGENTKLKLTHSGIGTFPADIPELAIQNFEQGWDQIINVSLKEFLEKK